MINQFVLPKKRLADVNMLRLEQATAGAVTSIE